MRDRPGQGPNQSSMGEVLAFDPRQGMPDETDRQQLARLHKIVSVPLMPRVEVAVPQNLQGDNTVDACHYETWYAEALTTVCRVVPTAEGSILNPITGLSTSTADATNPYNGVGTAFLPANLLQQIEVVGRILFGHGDCEQELAFNMPLGQLIRVQTMASAIKLKARLEPRYTPKLGVAPSFFWLSASAFQRNNLFNNPPNNILSANGPVAGWPPPTPVQVQAFVGRGFTSPVPPNRIFFGWVDAAAAQNTQHLCPIPNGAGTVILVSDATAVNNDPAAGGAFQGVGLTFNQVLASGRRSLNFPPDTTVPLRADCVTIEVVNVGIPPAGQGVPFELQFDVGF